MTIKDRVKIFFHYNVPNFINKHFCKMKLSEKGKTFFDYCMKVFDDEKYEADTYQEIIFDNKIENLCKEKGVDRKLRQQFI